MITLLKEELSSNPKDASLHVRLLKHYLQNNRHKEAFEHSFKIEFGGSTFQNNYAWYETLSEVLKHQANDITDWEYQLLLLTVLERLCILSLTETPTGTSKSLTESTNILHRYDQALEKVAQAGPPTGLAEFYSGLLQHHRGQLVFHLATLLLKKAKKDQIYWRDAIKLAAPLMLIAWHTVPLDTKVNWLTNAAEKQKVSVHRWYYEGSYRCSQSGHLLLAHAQEKSHTFLDQISQFCSETNWKEKIYEKIFTSIAYLNSSHFISKVFTIPTLRLPRKMEVEAYDTDSQKVYPNSLHHFVWILLDYKNFENFKCTVFDMLVTKSSYYPNCGPETLNKIDVMAYLYCATLTTQQLMCQNTHSLVDKFNKIPAHITDMLCTLSQLKWWDCAYKFSQNELGSELIDIRTTLTRGIEVVRCVDNHGLDAELLCKLGCIFSECAKPSHNIDEKKNLESRAALYYSCAIPLLEKLKKKLLIKLPEKRLFDYTHKELNTKELSSLLERSKLYMGITYLNDNEFDKAIDILSNLKSPQATYYLSESYKKMALDDSHLIKENTTETITKYLLKAKTYAYKTLNTLKDLQEDEKSPIYANTQALIEEIEILLNKTYADTTNDIDTKYFSDENASGDENMQMPLHMNSHVFRNLSSTPKQPQHFANMTNYKSAVESTVLENSKFDHKLIERIENQLKSIQKRDSSITSFMEQMKGWMDENRNLGNQVIGTVNTNIQNTIDQFKLLKLSVDQIKDQIFECRNDCKDIGDLKKEVAELKKEINKLKKSTTEQTVDENDLYNINDEFRNNENTASFPSQLPFTTSQIVPPFNQRIVPPFPVPPTPYQLYGQNLYNLYNHYSQFGQPPHVPVSASLFDPTRSSVHYPGVYPTPEQIYPDMTNIVPPTIQPVSASVPSTISVTQSVTPSVTKSAPLLNREPQLPVNVVITSSDPLPTCTTAPAQILSVTIPPEHIKSIPHNYQISMPNTNETQVMPPSLFNTNDLETPSSTKSLAAWMQSNSFKTTQSSNNSTPKVSAKIDNTALPSSESTITGGIFNISNANISNVSVSSPNVSANKSRTLSEKSNTSVENYDPCPDFKPIVPLPDEVTVTTGEENETVIFCARAKLFRFVDKQWKERGLGEMKLLKHNTSGKVRVLMRREQVHKICANHIITPEMTIQPMKNETKAYFWVANDFADENVVLEKFCVRFKSDDIARRFYETFEQAQKDAKSLNCNKIMQLKEPIVNKNTVEKDTKTENKTVIGGFTFSTTPAFKAVKNKDTFESNIASTPTTKLNLFSSLNLKTTTTTAPFSNLFTTQSNQNISVDSANQRDDLNRSASSDVVEEFEPSVEFKPVVPLPALVDQKTGEENEIILFEHRAKLLRFDNASKEWKECGLGNMKLLANKDNDKIVRLLMRREQVMKVCCNHALTKEMNFQKMPKTENAITWCAKDFSQGELVSETFCLRFKTSQIFNDFVSAIKSAQMKMKDNIKAVIVDQSAITQCNQTGFGDKFKPKPGSWQCNSCYTNNLDTFTKCACCEEPNPLNVVNLTQQTPVSVNWGDKFKPKPGTWECKECFIRNEKAADYCSVCTNPRVPKKDSESDVKTLPKYNFIMPEQNQTTKESGTFSWGSSIKVNSSSWECKNCSNQNESHIFLCKNCNNPKDDISLKFGDTNLTGKPAVGPKFHFGIPQAENSTITTFPQQPSVTGTSIFDGTGSHTFKFGISSVTKSESQPSFTFGSQTLNDNKNTSVVSSTTQITSGSTPDGSITVTPVKTPLLSTSQKDSTTAAKTFGTKGSAAFEFVFKPKSPPKVKSPKSEHEESDGNEYASEDEGHHIHFSPVVPMPDKVSCIPICIKN